MTAPTLEDLKDAIDDWRIAFERADTDAEDAMVPVDRLRVQALLVMFEWRDKFPDAPWSNQMIAEYCAGLQLIDASGLRQPVK